MYNVIVFNIYNHPSNSLDTSLVYEGFIYKDEHIILTGEFTVLFFNTNEYSCILPGDLFNILVVGMYILTPTLRQAIHMYLIWKFISSGTDRPVFR